jgi:hypothetical protein
MATTTTTTSPLHAAATTEASYVLHDGVAHMILASAAPMGTAFDRDTVAHDGVEHEILATHISVSRWSGARPDPEVAHYLAAVDARDQLRAELALVKLRMRLLARAQAAEMAELKARQTAEPTAKRQRRLH